MHVFMSTYGNPGASCGLPHLDTGLFTLSSPDISFKFVTVPLFKGVKMSKYGICVNSYRLFTVLLRRIGTRRVNMAICLPLDIYNISGSSPDADLNSSKALSGILKRSRALMTNSVQSKKKKKKNTNRL